LVNFCHATRRQERLNNRRTACRFPALAGDSLFTETSRPVLLFSGSGGSFRWSKAGVNVRLATYLHLVPRLRISALCLVNYLYLHGVRRDSSAFTFTLFYTADSQTVRRGAA
jgi:hypothetical protein